METVLVEIFINRMPNGKLTGSASDMATIGWPLVSTYVVEIDVPEPSRSEVVAAEISMLENQSKKLMTEAKAQAGEMQSRIDALKGGLND